VICGSGAVCGFFDLYIRCRFLLMSGFFCCVIILHFFGFFGIFLFFLVIRVIFRVLTVFSCFFVFFKSYLVCFCYLGFVLLSISCCGCFGFLVVWVCSMVFCFYCLFLFF